MQCKKNMSTSMLCCSSWQSSILPESISETFFKSQTLKSHVVCAACSVIVRLSLAGNGMMNKLTIKLARRQVQGMGIFPSFHGSSKEKARRRNSCSSYICNFSRQSVHLIINASVTMVIKRKYCQPVYHCVEKCVLFWIMWNITESQSSFWQNWSKYDVT